MADQDKPLIDWKVESQRFNGVATKYEKYRPTYPTALIEDLISLSGIQPGSAILEIGSGTGKATRLFAQRGHSILCLEPGQNLIDVAKVALSAYPQLRFEKARFEEWDAGEKRFDLIYSAQAFHWVPQEVRYVKTAVLLKPKRHLATFWNMYPGFPGALGDALDKIYVETVPEIVGEKFDPQEVIAQRKKSLEAEANFENVQVRTYPWTAVYTTEAYLGLLGTYSDHLRLTEPKRQRLFAAIADLIEENGGVIERPYLGVLYFAQRK
ncbi:class I SAM-dependent methyltransferase [Candidatus Leptofilum sp.]|uniref:class I SAM-dependent methyltransferase n=1 Tax=Candidatus Leptofilum sp. TaxID=3241576 RepID=UPI003B5B5C06